MTTLIKSEMTPFIDVNGLVSPNRDGPSDNGVMFTAEYLLMLERLDELDYDTAKRFRRKIRACFKEPGLLMRRPDNFGGQDGPDNMLGLAIASQVLGRRMGGDEMASEVMIYGLDHWGAFNNIDGKWTTQSFLWRQPQLVGALMCGVMQQARLVNLSRFQRATLWLFARPFLLCAALSIFVSCRGTDPGETDPRRLSWLLIQATFNHSWLCRVASRGWYERLYRDYSSAGMKAVARIYYSVGHPFIKYWVDGPWHE